MQKVHINKNIIPEGFIEFLELNDISELEKIGFNNNKVLHKINDWNDQYPSKRISYGYLYIDNQNENVSSAFYEDPEGNIKKIDLDPEEEFIITSEDNESYDESNLNQAKHNMFIEFASSEYFECIDSDILMPDDEYTVASKVDKFIADNESTLAYFIYEHK